MHYNDRTYVMGILNITPDSFSDGGRYFYIDDALKRAEVMVKDGADILDVGGESTRPQASFVSAEEELERVIPVIQKLRQNIDIPISVDTYKSVVAQEAIKAGATIINDIWGLKYDTEMAKIIALHDVQVVIMHNQEGTVYKDYLRDIVNALQESVSIAAKAGVKRENIILDPGFGFGKDTQQNLYLLKQMDVIKELGLPILVGTSRKSMIGNTLHLPAQERMEGTAATVVLAITKGANIIRVHDVKEMARVARMTDAVMQSNLGGE